MTDSQPTGGAGSALPSAALGLAVSGVYKSFGAVLAVNGASLEAGVGEVVALMGDNGAGKSSLIRCIAGVYQADAGTFELGGKPLDTSSATKVLEQGVETVYQDLALVGPMSASRNVFLGREVLRTDPLGRMLRLADDREMSQRAQQALTRLGAKIPDLRNPVETMSGGQRQAIAIARAVLWGHQLVILDEPTAALGLEQSAHVLDMIRALRDGGVTVVLISHNLEHVWKVADRVTVMRRGQTVGSRAVSDTVPDEIVSLITGSTPQ